MNVYDYGRLSSLDVVSQMKPFLDDGSYYLRDDGKIDSARRMSPDSPWIFVKHAPNKECHLWHGIYFQVFGIIPSPCHECWKVVLRPWTLQDLMRVYNLQKKMDEPAKCGIERRLSVFGSYGAYWYANSVEEGRHRWVQVVSAMEDLGIQCNAILKRGCTEFELTKGPSDEWEITEDQIRLENVLNNAFVRDVVVQTQPDHVRAAIFRSWVHHAYSVGDETYRMFLRDGQELFRKVVEYQIEKGSNNG
jgi:hypothetical protein